MVTACNFINASTRKPRNTIIFKIQSNEGVVYTEANPEMGGKVKKERGTNLIKETNPLNFHRDGNCVHH